ncbi:MAG: hypothetical protein GWN64_05250 [Candidatus Thorarchaeota archaeon]|nr:hypothetical protein [Candidatus Thorarchaeota archaeon]
MIINWALYILAVPFIIVDHYQTKALVEYGLKEANPVVLWLIGESHNWDALLYYKVVALSILGLLLLYKQLFQGGEK